MYFAWLGHYTTALIVPAAVGVIYWVRINPFPRRSFRSNQREGRINITVIKRRLTPSRIYCRFVRSSCPIHSSEKSGRKKMNSVDVRGDEETR